MVTTLKHSLSGTINIPFIQFLLLLALLAYGIHNLTRYYQAEKKQISKAQRIDALILGVVQLFSGAICFFLFYFYN